MSHLSRTSSSSFSMCGKVDGPYVARMVKIIVVSNIDHDHMWKHGLALGGKDGQDNGLDLDHM